MSSFLKSISRFVASKNGAVLVETATPEAWETTARLRKQLWYTHVNAMPARVDAAVAEWKALVEKVRSKHVTVGETTTASARLLELYAYFCLGKLCGGVL